MKKQTWRGSHSDHCCGDRRTRGNEATHQLRLARRPEGADDTVSHLHHPCWEARLFTIMRARVYPCKDTDIWTITFTVRKGTEEKRTGNFSPVVVYLSFAEKVVTYHKCMDV